MIILICTTAVIKQQEWIETTERPCSKKSKVSKPKKIKSPHKTTRKQTATWRSGHCISQVFHQIHYFWTIKHHMLVFLHKVGIKFDCAWLHFAFCLVILAGTSLSSSSFPGVVFVKLSLLFKFRWGPVSFLNNVVFPLSHSNRAAEKRCIMAMCQYFNIQAAVH